MAIIGAGPVGLLLANLLGARGLRTLLVEKRTELPATSMAIGITPPSMEILSTLGLHDRFAENGVRIREAGVHDERGVLGRLSFERVASPFNYVLSIPQRRTVEILRDAVRGQNTVEYREGWSFESFDEDDGHITAHLHREIPHARESVSARILVGCDGHRSTVRNCAGLRMSRKLYPVSFAMGEFLDRSGLGEEARLYFTPEGSLESFPLPGGRRRWITMLREEPSDQAEHLAQRVTAVTGFEPDLA
ncbi:MAG: FAD-dependent monooxygenase, partial [Kiritimatiellae bacterium]|nr:FAD-dependent monooxygenase [Kiritimatiellia bacterium]